MVLPGATVLSLQDHMGQIPRSKGADLTMRLLSQASENKHPSSGLNTCNGIDFSQWNFKPKPASSILQAQSCSFFGCNLRVLLFPAFMDLLCFVYFKITSRDFCKQGWVRFRQRQARGFLMFQPIRKKPPSIVYK